MKPDDDESDISAIGRALKEHRKEQRAEFGVKCPECVRLLPKANATILLPGRRCRIHKYTDPRDEAMMYPVESGDE